MYLLEVVKPATNVPEVRVEDLPTPCKVRYDGDQFGGGVGKALHRGPDAEIEAVPTPGQMGQSEAPIK